MKFLAGTALVIGALSALAGCASTKFADEPKDSVSTLVIGQIRLTTRGLPAALDVKKTYTDGIELHLRKEPSGVECVVYSRGSDGYFSLIPDEGTYRLMKVALTAGEHTPSERIDFIWSFERPFGAGSGVIFRVEDNKVNNLGVVVSASDYTSETYRPTTRGFEYESDTHTLASGDFEKVAAWFAERYPESGWNAREWVDTKLVSGEGGDISGFLWTGDKAEYWKKKLDQTFGFTMVF